MLDAEPQVILSAAESSLHDPIDPIPQLEYRPPSYCTMSEGGQVTMKNNDRALRVGAMDYGVLAGFILLIFMFEAIPGTGIGRLASRTVTDEMQGFDPGELYEIPPELPEEQQIDVEKLIQSEIPDVVQPDQVMSLSSDTTGLSSALTVEINNLSHVENPNTGVIPDPGTFIPHSIPPSCTYRPLPDYPAMARQAGVEGRVTLQVFVSAEGEPVEAVIVQSSGLNSMDSAALTAVMESSWSPAKRDDGVAVAVWTAIVYNFVLQ